MKGFTIKQIEQMKKEGKIRDFKVMNPPKQDASLAGRRVGKHFKKPHPQKDWMARELLQWCQERGIILYEEYNFNPLRQWRFDWVVIGKPMGGKKKLKIGVEYEGIRSEKSRHTTAQGYSKDAEKYNSAQSLGWTVLRYTALNYENVITDLNNLA